MDGLDDHLVENQNSDQIEHERTSALGIAIGNPWLNFIVSFFYVLQNSKKSFVQSNMLILDRN